MQGRTLRGYEVWGKLGEGGMSEVWLARHAELAMPVVIKTLNASSEAPSVRYQRLRNEARMMARITSNNVVRVLDIGVDHEADPATPFLVEEYVDGLDLAELDARRRAALKRALPIWAVAQFVAEAAEGLGEVHQGGVIHCDVKPSNLFASPHGALKVGDFGVATATASAGAGALGGTPWFMAPEALRGERVDSRSDVYSLGATAFTLRYGAPPAAITGERACEVVVQMPPARSPEEAYFQHLVGRMMAPKPDARFDSMLTVKQAFRKLAQAAFHEHPTSSVSPNELIVAGVRVTFEMGDLSAVAADAVVNSANWTMKMRSGVGEALRARGGHGIEEEAIAGGERALGDCVLTGPGRLACRGVLHAVGAWNEVSCIARATQRALLLAEENGFRTVALPAIGNGMGRVGIEACADAMASALARHVALGSSRLSEVRFVLCDAGSLDNFREVARSVLLDGSDAAVDDERLDAPASADDAETGATVFAPSGAQLASAS